MNQISSASMHSVSATIRYHYHTIECRAMQRFVSLRKVDSTVCATNKQRILLAIAHCVRACSQWKRVVWHITLRCFLDDFLIVRTVTQRLEALTNSAYALAERNSDSKCLCLTYGKRYISMMTMICWFSCAHEKQSMPDQNSNEVCAGAHADVYTVVCQQGIGGLIRCAIFPIDVWLIHTAEALSHACYYNGSLFSA